LGPKQYILYFMHYEQPQFNLMAFIDNNTLERNVYDTTFTF